MESTSNKSQNKKGGLNGQTSKINKILNFYPLKGTSSKVTCHGMPKQNEIKFMKLTYGVNYVLTLLYQKEAPERIHKACQEIDIKWQHIELLGANMPYFKSKGTQQQIIEGLLKLYDVLRNEKVVLFMHCAAGIHRTGTLLYSILRMFDETAQTSLKAIEYIRLDTRNKVGNERIKLAETVIVPILLAKIKGVDIPMGMLSIKEEKEDNENTQKQV